MRLALPQPRFRCATRARPVVFWSGDEHARAPMSLQQAIDDAVEHIYAASCDPGEWQAVTERCRAFFPGSAFAFLIKATADYDPLSAAAGWDPYWLDQFWTHFHKINPYEPLFRNIPPGKIVRASQLVTKRWLQTTPFYNEWLKPAGDYTHGAGVTLAHSHGRFARLTFDIPERMKHLEAPAAALLRRLGPHFMRALDVASRMEGGRISEHAFQAFVDRLAGAAFAVSANRRILYANPDAVRLLEYRTLVRDTPPGCLSFLHHHAEERLRIALASSAVGSSSTHTTTFVAYDGDRRFTVHVLPLRVARALPVSQANAPVTLVLIVPGDTISQPASALLRDLYSLSQREAAVVLQVANGASLAETAEVLGVTTATARNQLASAMTKLGVHRRAELVALIGGIAPRIKLGPLDS